MVPTEESGDRGCSDGWEVTKGVVVVDGREREGAGGGMGEREMEIRTFRT